MRTASLCVLTLALLTATIVLGSCASIAQTTQHVTSFSSTSVTIVPPDDQGGSTVTAKPETTSTSTAPQHTQTLDQAQQSILDSIADILRRQGVPLKSIEVATDGPWSPSRAIRAMLQSSSTGDKLAPDDVISSSLIYRAVNLAQQRGLNAVGVNTVVVNVNGKTISDSGKRLKSITSLSEMSPPFKLDGDTVRALLIENIPASELSVKSISVTQGSDDLRRVVFDLETTNIQTANDGIGKFMLAMMIQIPTLNRTQNTQISAYQVNLNNSSGEVLFKYLNDLLLGSQLSWQIDGLTWDWSPFSHGPGLDSTSRVLPEPGRTEVATLPLFDWKDLAGAGGFPSATRFELIASTSNTVDNNGRLVTPDVLDLTGNATINGQSYQMVTPLKSNTVYYWQVRPMAKDANASQWSDVFAFRTGP